MVNIEQTIVELGTIFQQLAHMVKEQDEVILRYGCIQGIYFAIIDDFL